MYFIFSQDICYQSLAMRGQNSGKLNYVSFLFPRATLLLYYCYLILMLCSFINLYGNFTNGGVTIITILSFITVSFSIMMVNIFYQWSTLLLNKDHNSTAFLKVLLFHTQHYSQPMTPLLPLTYQEICSIKFCVHTNKKINEQEQIMLGSSAIWRSNHYVGEGVLPFVICLHL